MKLLRHLVYCFFLISSPAFSQDLGGGFTDHGVATPISNHRGTVATIDGEGRNVVLIWLFDHRGGYALLMVDAETGKSEEYKMPFPPGKDTPYSSILSSDNKFYTAFNGNFVEFDPVKKAFTFHSPIQRQMAMSMTEDDNGVIWAATYPNSGVVSFNPKTREFKDFGYVYKQNWPQYQRYMVADDQGWIYFGLGNTFSQIIAFNPNSGQAQPMLAEADRKRGIAYVYRDLNGKVYGQTLAGKDEEWYEFYNGEGKKIGTHEIIEPKSYITGSQALFHNTFPDGKKLLVCDLTERKLVVEDPKTKIRKEVEFDYTSEGAWVMGVGASPDGKISGGTSFPMRFFSFNPDDNSWVNQRAAGQFNALTRQGDSFFFGGYPNGFLMEWKESKPVRFIDCSPIIHRPHRLLAHPDGKTLIMGGTPQYGYTGGGLLFFDRVTEKSILLQDSNVVLDQSTMSLVALPNGKILGGTTIAPGTGGERKASVAEMYKMDIESKKLEWNKVVIPGVQSYTDMCMTPEGLVYGITDRNRFFVFDAVEDKIIHQQDLKDSFGLTAAEQSPRVFVRDENNKIYILFRKGIGTVEPGTYKINLIAESPVPIDAGGDYLKGKIYFVGGSHIYSYKLESND